jgi:UDP-N-acetylmuramoyl-tripeptide--D-alanyl-D-alanine ligase
MKLAVENMARLDGTNKWLLLGAMKEMGEAMQQEHQSLVNMVAEAGFEQVILVGNEFAAVAHSYLWFENSAKAKEYLQAHLPQDATILIKGSRGSRMEVVLEAF